jgi:hypothetical protein
MQMNQKLNSIAQSPPDPGVFKSLGWGWNSMKANFLVFFLTIIVLGIIQAPTSWQDHEYDNEETSSQVEDAQQTADGEEADSPETERSMDTVRSSPGPFWALLIMAYQILVVPAFKYGADLVFLRGTRGEKVEMKTLIEGFSKYLNVILASLLAFALIAIGFIFFIIPGIIVACRLAFVPYLVMDEDMDPIEAVEGSWRLTRGHAWQVFGLYFLAIPIFFIGLLLMVVGVIPALMWISSAFSAMYLSVSGSKNEPEETAPEDSGNPANTTDSLDA